MRRATGAAMVAVRPRDLVLLAGYLAGYVALDWAPGGTPVPWVLASSFAVAAVLRRGAALLRGPLRLDAGLSRLRDVAWLAMAAQAPERPPRGADRGRTRARLTPLGTTS